MCVLERIYSRPKQASQIPRFSQGGEVVAAEEAASKKAGKKGAKGQSDKADKKAGAAKAAAKTKKAKEAAPVADIPRTQRAHPVRGTENVRALC